MFNQVERFILTTDLSALVKTLNKEHFGGYSCCMRGVDGEMILCFEGCGSRGVECMHWSWCAPECGAASPPSVRHSLPISGTITLNSPGMEVDKHMSTTKHRHDDQ